ncbi:MAG: tetratricopeptide repeat protein [Candidatus Sulfotelmatobacter sp.]
MTGMPRASYCWCFSLGLSLVFLASMARAAQQGSSESHPITVTFEQLSAQATSAREAGRVDDACLLYERALKLQPDWAEGWWYLGTLNYDADHYAEAIPALQSLVSLNPRLGPALAFLGLSEFETKDYKDALDHLQQAQQQGYGDDAELAKVASYHLALLYNWNGAFGKTVEVLTPEIEHGRPPDEIKMALGMALLRVPLPLSDIDPERDALIHAAGEAAVLLYGHNSASAVEAFRQLLREYPKTPYLHYACADALESVGRLEEALGELAEETKVSPRSALPYVRMASLNLQLRQAKQALPRARQAVFLAPRSNATHRVLAQTLKSLGDVQEATKELVVAEKLDANPVEVDLSQRQLYVRRQAEESAMTADSGESFEALTQKAAAAQAAGQIDAAIFYYQRALTLRPHWEEGWRNLGTLCYAADRYADAIAALKNSVAINDQNGNVWALLGLSEFETKDYKNSLIHLERGSDLGFAGNAAAVRVAQYHLAILLNRSGGFDKATELLTVEITSGPPDEQVKLALGMALLRIPLLPHELDQANTSLVRLAGETAALLSQSRYDQAFSDFQQLLKINSSMPYLHYAYGSALASASRYDEAEEQLAEETKITPTSALPFLRRSNIALQLHHTENAVQFAQRAVKLAPESAEAHYLLGRSWLEVGKTADSVTELETARGLAPNSPEVRFSLARAYAKAGQSDAAEQERAAFERLNALVQSQRSRQGSQAYGAIQNQNGIRTTKTGDQD